MDADEARASRSRADHLRIKALVTAAASAKPSQCAANKKNNDREIG